MTPSDPPVWPRYRWRADSTVLPPREVQPGKCYEGVPVDDGRRPGVVRLRDDAGNIIGVFEVRRLEQCPE